VIRVTMDKTLTRTLLKNKELQVSSALKVALNESLALLLARVQVKLSGEVLHHRTGKLLGSARMNAAQGIGQTLTGSVVSSGGPAWYGRVHENGPTTIPAVAGKLMVFEAGGKTVFTMKRRAFVLPKRAFMSPSLDELRGTIIAKINLAAARAVRS
jgi:hypothetical protein